MTPEGLTKKEIRAVLDSYGDELWYDMPVKMGMGKRVVDFLICFRGFFLAIEAKRKGKEARKFQVRIMDRVRRAGGGALCIDNAAQLHAVLNFVAQHEVSRCGTTQTARS